MDVPSHRGLKSICSKRRLIRDMRREEKRREEMLSTISIDLDETDASLSSVLLSSRIPKKLSQVNRSPLVQTKEIQSEEMS